jgi:hypothetical protein
VGDFTGDGRIDVALVGRQSETGLVYHNTGDPDRPFEADDRTTFGIDAHPVRSGPVAADWTGGGADDLLIPHRGHDLTVVSGGDGGPPADRVETVSLDHFVHHENVVSVADFGGESPPALATYGNTSLGGGASEPSGVFVWHPERS